MGFKKIFQEQFPSKLLRQCARTSFASTIQHAWRAQREENFNLYCTNFFKKQRFFFKSLLETQSLLHKLFTKFSSIFLSNFESFCALVGYPPFAHSQAHKKGHKKGHKKSRKTNGLSQQFLTMGFRSAPRIALSWTLFLRICFKLALLYAPADLLLRFGPRTFARTLIKLENLKPKVYYTNCFLQYQSFLRASREIVKASKNFLRASCEKKREGGDLSKFW